MPRPPIKPKGIPARRIHAVPVETSVENFSLAAGLQQMIRTKEAANLSADAAHLTGVLTALGDLRHRVLSVQAETSDPGIKTLMAEILAL